MYDGQINDRRFKRKMAKAYDVARHTGPIMRKVAGNMMDAVETNFAMEGRPKWKRLKPKTIAARIKNESWPGKILQVQGAAGGLAGSIHSSYTRTDAIVGTTLKYAKFLQKGTKHMKARPFLKLTPNDLTEIKKFIKFEFVHEVK